VNVRSGAEEVLLKLRLAGLWAGGGARCSNWKMAMTANSTVQRFMTVSYKMASTEPTWKARQAASQHVVEESGIASAHRSSKRWITNSYRAA
jgi:hypothetical protein